MQRSDTPGSTALHAVADPLGDFSSERPAPMRPATVPPAPVRPAVQPALRRVVARRASVAPVARPVRATTADTRRGVWLFALGAVCGVVLGVIGLYWLTISEPPRVEPVARAAPELPVPEPPSVVEPVREPRVAADTSRAAVLPPVPPAAAPSPAAEDVRRPAVAARPEPAVVKPFVGSLQVDSTPQGAQVFIDRQAVGVTPLLLTALTAGSHAIRVEAEGHTPWSSAIRVIADRQTDVNTVLAPAIDTPRP